MSGLIEGSVNFDNDINLNVIKKTIPCTMRVKTDLTKTNKIPYFELLTRIKNNEVETEELFVKVTNFNDREIYRYSDGCFITKDGLYITDSYDDMDLVDIILEIQQYEKESPEDTLKAQVTEDVIEEIEDLWADLDMQIDNCQGCMSGLEEAFARLKIYEDIIKYLGGDLSITKSAAIDRWYKRAREAEDMCKKIKAEKDAVITTLNLPPLDLVMLQGREPVIGNALISIQDKINEICTLLRNSKN